MKPNRTVSELLESARATAMSCRLVSMGVHFYGEHKDELGQTLEALCDEIEQRGLLLQEAEAGKYVPGLWSCEKCIFTQQNSYLHANSGAIAPNLDAKPPSCPNDGTRMIRTTWQAWSKVIGDACESHVKAKVKMADRLDWVFSSLDDREIMRRVTAIGNAFALRMDGCHDVISAIDACMVREPNRPS